MNKEFSISGKVTSVMGNTVKVLVERRKTHPKYNKSYTVSKLFMAHLPKSMKIEVGEEVVMIPNKKISKRKAWLIKQ